MLLKSFTNYDKLDQSKIIKPSFIDYVTLFSSFALLIKYYLILLKKARNGKYINNISKLPNYLSY